MNSRQGTTKSQGQKHPLDKFYTKTSVAAQCLSKLDLDSYDEIIEPSAGNGAFSNLIPNVKAFDISPEHPNVIKQDWLKYSQTRDHKKVLVVGNPPYGQQNTLALAFINHAAKFASTVAFVLPVSFMKTSLQEKIDQHFHLTYFEVLPVNSFILNGVDYKVRSVFQVWEFKETLRPQLPSINPVGFKFVRKNASPDFYIRRIGGKAGTFGSQWQDKNEQSHYFIKATGDKNLIKTDFEKLVFPESTYSVGPKSISQQEILNELYTCGSLLVEKTKQ